MESGRECDAAGRAEIKVGTHGATGLGHLDGTGYSKLLISFNFVSRAKPG